MCSLHYSAACGEMALTFAPESIIAFIVCPFIWTVTNSCLPCVLVTVQICPVSGRPVAFCTFLNSAVLNVVCGPNIGGGLRSYAFSASDLKGASSLKHGCGV